MCEHALAIARFMVVLRALLWGLKKCGNNDIEAESEDTKPKEHDMEAESEDAKAKEPEAVPEQTVPPTVSVPEVPSPRVLTPVPIVPMVQTLPPVAAPVTAPMTAPVPILKQSRTVEAI